MANGLYEADQAEESRKELAGNQRYESPGSNPPLSSGRHRARMAGWVDENAGCPGYQSRILEVDGCQVSAELSADPQSVVCPPYEMYALPTKSLPSLPLQRGSSPELRHPVHSDPERDSLWQKLRGTAAAHSHRSSADPRRSDWTDVGVTENTTSSLSWRQSMPDGSLYSIPSGGDEIQDNNTNTLQGDASAPYQPNVRLMSQEVSPEDPAPTKHYPLVNAASSSSPEAAFASLPSDISPISPIVEHVHPPLTIASSTTLSHHGSSPGTTEHHEENAVDQTSILSSPPQLMPKEPNNALPFFGTRNSDIQSPLPLYDSMQSSVPIVPHTDNGISQLSLPAVQKIYQSEDLNVPSVSTQPPRLRMYLSDQECFIQSNASENVSVVNQSSSMYQSFVAQLYTPRVEKPDLSQIRSSPTSLSQNRRTQPDLQYANKSQSPLEPTQPSSVFHIPPFSLLSNRHVTEPIMETGDFDHSDTSTENPEQSNTGQSFCLLDAQPWSPPNNLIGTNTIDRHSTGLQWDSSDHCPQAASQHQSRDSRTGQTLLFKWRPFCFDHNSFLVSELAPKLQQVEDLQDLIRTINYEWMQRMESQPGLWSFCSTLPSSSLFDRAIRTSKNFICGSPAEGFEDIFALMHLAFAAAFSLTWQQDDYSFSSLCDDALQWQHALPRDEDKTRFLDSMDCWRLHELEPPPLFTNVCHSNLRSMMPQEPLHCGNQQTLRDRLSKGEVFKAVIAFVDSKLIRTSISN